MGFLPLFTSENKVVHLVAGLVDSLFESLTKSSYLTGRSWVSFSHLTALFYSSTWFTVEDMVVDSSGPFWFDSGNQIKSLRLVHYFHMFCCKIYLYYIRVFVHCTKCNFGASTSCRRRVIQGIERTEAEVNLEFRVTSYEPLPQTTEIVSTMKEAVADQNNSFNITVDTNSISKLKTHAMILWFKQLQSYDSTHDSTSVLQWHRPLKRCLCNSPYNEYS